MPKRIRKTFSSRGVKVASTLRVCSARFMLITASEGETRLLSSMKSPRCESSSSPIGVSREIGSLAIYCRRGGGGWCVFCVVAGGGGGGAGGPPRARGRGGGGAGPTGGGGGG